MLQRYCNERSLENALVLEDPTGKTPSISPGTLWVSAKIVGAVDSTRLAIQNAEGAVETSDVKNNPIGRIVQGVELTTGMMDAHPTLASTISSLLMKLDSLNTVISRIDELAKVRESVTDLLNYMGLIRPP